MNKYPLLDKIDDPADLRRLERRDLSPLAKELREFIVESVSATGGHFSSNLGTVELTIALHYVFNTPDDRLVWDVGHQTYGHKILTGRKAGMPKLRQKGGIAGFPRREESIYDTFGTAHSSTSISAALGMAVAARVAGVKRNAIAIIGDGAITAGMAFEAMNNVGRENLIVILNDNDMSISESIGALNNYLSKLMSGRFYANTKKTAEKILSATPTFKEIAKRVEEHAKGMITPSTMFEEFGFNYTGPIDGHNIDVLVDTLNNIKQLGGPQFLHVVTKKGQGYKLAEEDPINYHGPSKFDPKIGVVSAIAVPDAKPKPSYTQIFGEWLCDMARADKRVIGITPAMREGSGMTKFSQQFPDRYFDVAIAEQHAVTFAAGLAADGMKPVLAIYSTFLQRGYDHAERHTGLALLDVDSADDAADHASRATAEQTADCAAEARADPAAARIAVGRDNVGLEEIIGGLDLALADIAAALKLAIISQRTLHRAALHRAAAVDDSETARALDEDLDDRLGAAEIELAPPFIVGLDDRDCPEPPLADRDFAHGVQLHVAARAGAGVAGLGRGLRCKQDDCTKRGCGNETYHDNPR